MKTKNDFKYLNIEDYAFFKGVSIVDAKNEFTKHVFPDNWLELHYEELKNLKKSKYLTDTGIPKISKRELVNKDSFDFTMKSNSNLDGKNQLDYLCDFYNNGVPLNTLREFSQNRTYQKSICFTGKNSIINQILNPSQLRKLQETWLYSNIHSVARWSEKTIDFIKQNNWTKEFLNNKGYSESLINEQFEYLEELKNKDKYQKTA